MGTHARSRRRLPSVEGLEERRLLTIGSSSSSYNSALAAAARHQYDQFVSEVQSVELQSQATPAQYLALRDDSRAISEAAASSTLSPTAISSKALAITIEIDRSPLYGSLSDQGWAQETTKLERAFAGLNIPPSLLNQTITDMKAVAASAGVTSDEYSALIANLAQVRSTRSQVPSGYGHIPDPGLFYTQHLRGFFRGWAVQRTADQARLNADLHTIPASAHARSANAAAVSRDAGILQALGAPIPSPANDQLLGDYVAAFANGSPTASELSTLQTQIVAALGSTATATRRASVNRLIADAPAFYQGVGASLANVQTIANDVRAVVNDGAGASLDPFKITVSAG